MAPVLVVAGPARPAAAVTLGVGPTVQGKFSGSRLLPESDYACSVTGYTRVHDTNLYSVRAVLRCEFGPLFEQSDRIDLAAYGSGPNCRFIAEAIDVSTDEQNDRELTLTARLTAPDVVSASCNLTSGSFDLYKQYAPPGCSLECQHETGSFSWPLGLMPKPNVEDDTVDKSCNVFRVTKQPRIDSYSVRKHPPLGNFTDKPSLYVKGGWSGEWLAGADSGNVVSQTIYVRKAAGGPVSVYSDFVRDQIVAKPSANAVGVTGWKYPTVDGMGRFDGYSLPDTTLTIGSEYPKVVGVWISVSGETNPTNWGPGNTTGCGFYWGEKVNDLANTTVDDPAGPLKFGPNATPPTEPDTVDPGTPDDRTETGCEGFSFTDPSSWAGAGICVMVKVLRTIVGVLGTMADYLAAAVSVLGDVLSAILDLGSAIVSGIVDALAAVFIPSDGYISGQIDQTRAAWQDTPPGEIVGELEGIGNRLDAPSDDGCQGPELTLDLPMFGGATTLHPAAACGGGKEFMAGLVKTVLTVGLLIGAALVSLRMMLSAFGMHASIGGDGKD